MNTFAVSLAAGQVAKVEVREITKVDIAVALAALLVTSKSKCSWSLLFSVMYWGFSDVGRGM